MRDAPTVCDFYEVMMKKEEEKGRRVKEKEGETGQPGYRERA
jgi:hypothetical protein